MRTATQVPQRLEWLVDRAEAGRAELRRGRFFQMLEGAGSIDDLRHYFAQLACFSPLAIGAILARAVALDVDTTFGIGASTYGDTWRRHAAAEADHVEMYARWREENGVEADERPTRATLELGAVLAYSASREWPPLRVLRLNLASEGVALDVFSASLGAFERLGINPGPGGFWRTHRAADAEHMLMGIDFIPAADSSSELGRQYGEVVDHTLDMFGRMLDTWA